MQTPAIPLSQQARPIGRAPSATIGPMGFGEAIAACFSKYIQFSGRSRRAEYWYWTLFVLLLNIALGFVVAMTHVAPEAIQGLVTLVLLRPGFGVFVRRLHDTDRSGWWCLLSLTGIGVIVLLVWMCQQGTQATNRFGPRTT